MMWMNLQNTILPNEYVQRMQTFKQADKMNATSYRYNDMSYRITNRQRDLMLLYHWLPPIVMGIAVGVSGGLFFTSEALEILCRALFGVVLGILTYRMTINLFVREADKNILSE